MQFQVGQRVRVVSDYIYKSNVRDKFGTVKILKHSESIGVEMDDEMGGHHLDGHAKQGHGRWYDEIHLMPVVETKEEALSDLINKRITPEIYESLR